MTLLLPQVIYASSDFFNQRYRGWLWFEEKEKLESEKALKKQHEDEIRIKKERVKAREEVEYFAKELEELRYMMIRYPQNLQHVLAYKKKEAEMLENAIKLDQSYRMANFVDPSLTDHLNNPINLYGRRIKENIDKQSNESKIKSLASKVELFLFFSSSCPYFQQLEPVLNDFITKYGFKIEAVSMDGSKSKYFKTHNDQDMGLSLTLGLKVTPSVIMVTNNSEISFELVRGAVSLSELEENSLLALKYLKQQEASNISEPTKEAY